MEAWWRAPPSDLVGCQTRGGQAFVFFLRVAATVGSTGLFNWIQGFLSTKSKTSWPLFSSLRSIFINYWTNDKLGWKLKFSSHIGYLDLKFRWLKFRARSASWPASPLTKSLFMWTVFSDRAIFFSHNNQLEQYFDLFLSPTELALSWGYQTSPFSMVFHG